MKNKFWVGTVLFLLTGSFLLIADVTNVPILPVYETDTRPESNTLDSPAIWVDDDPANSILFVTAKGSNNVEMHNPVTNQFIGVLGEGGSGPGQFNYPNGIAVAYDFNYNGSLIDLVMVVERHNHRVSVFDVPGLNFLGTFGGSDLDEPYGIAVYQDGTDIYSYITETGSNEGVFIYKLATASDTVGATLVKHFPVAGTLESVVVDNSLNRTLVCNEISGGYIYVYSLWGDTLITTFGQGHFIGEPEGIVLFDCGADSGYIVVVDQFSPTEFEIFNRKTYQHIGTFTGTEPYLTSGTDGAAITQRSLPNLPGGGYFAVHSDRVVHCYDWRDIANAFGLCSGIGLPPVWSIPPALEFPEDGSLNIDLDAFLSDGNDPNSALAITYQSGANVNVSLNNTTHLAIFTAPLNFNGSDEVIFTATDPVGLSASDTVTIQVTAVNDTPIVSLPLIEFEEDSTFTFDLDTLVSDVDSDTGNISWSFAFPATMLASIQKQLMAGLDLRIHNNQGIRMGANDSLMIEIDDLTHIATISATPNFYGLDIAVAFTAVDDSGAGDSDTTTISVFPINDPPVIIVPLAPVFFDEDDTLTYPFSLWFPFVSDPDHPVEQLSYLLLPGQYVSTDSGSNGYTLSASQNWFGGDTLQLIVSDGILADSADFYVTVHPVNDPPILELPLSVQFTPDTSYTLNIWEFAADVETADSLLSYDFDASTNSLLTDFNAFTGDLTLSAQTGFSGAAILYATASDDSGAAAIDSMEVLVSPLVGIGALTGDNIPTEYVLQQNYPNPFNPATHIRFGLPQAGQVKITVYNVLGQRVAVLLNERREAGYHTVNFEGANMASGIYLYHIQAGSFRTVKKMLLMK